MNFFRLPSDLHKLIFQSWIGDDADGRYLLMALSALDVACCRKRLRADFLQLTSDLTFSAIRNDEIKVSHYGSDILCYMAWLADRRVAVRSLFISSHMLQDLQAQLEVHHVSLPLPTTPSVVHLTIASTPCALALECILRACPRVTSIHTDTDQSSVASMMGPMLGLTPLRELAYRIHCTDTALTAVLGVHGSHLTNLTISANSPLDLATLLSHTMCPCLTQLAISEWATDSSQLLRLLEGLPYLVQLELKPLPCDVRLFAAILQQDGRSEHLKVFKVTTTRQFNLTRFVELLSGHAWLKTLQVDEWVVCRQTGHLGILQDTVPDGIRLLLESLCPVLRKLTVSGKPRDGSSFAGSLLEVVGTLHGSGLQELILHRVDPFSVNKMVQMCPNLLYMTLQDVYFFQPLMMTIGTTCQQLQTLVMEECDCTFHFGCGRANMDAVLRELLGTCSKLRSLKLGFAKVTHSTAYEYVTPRISLRTLQAIVSSNRLHLEEVIFKGSIGMSSKDIEQFVKLAQERQRLPVPRIILLGQ